jgi:hypothetical protein
VTLEEIEKLLSEATPGPWEHSVCHHCDWTCGHHSAGPTIKYDDDEKFTEQCSKDANLIAASPTIIRQLLDVAKAAKVVEYNLENAKDCDCCDYNRKLIDEELTPALQALEAKASE